jgi:hypothetical protein
MARPGPVVLLYWNPYGGRLRDTVRRHLAAVAAAAPRRGLVAFNAVGGAPPVLARLRPSAVILHTTFLATRWLSSFDDWRERGAWLGRVEAPKIALPQDDYDHADVLDEWLEDIGATAILTPLAEHTTLYPRMRATARIRPVLTGYVDRKLARALAPTLRPLPDRPFDVVYRATTLPYWFGSHGRLKRLVGDEAAAAAARRGWAADVSTTSVITGRAWFEHLASGRAVVGSESGSSVLDRRGEIRRGVEQILEENPGATFEQVAAQMPAGWDGTPLAALSPRHLEAAMTRTPQVLVRGGYSGVLAADRHYVPVEPDLSDLADALATALEPAVGRRLADAAWDELVESDAYDYERLTEAVRSELPERIGSTSAWHTAAVTPARLHAAVRRAGSLLVSRRAA